MWHMLVQCHIQIRIYGISALPQIVFQSNNMVAQQASILNEMVALNKKNSAL